MTNIELVLPIGEKVITDLEARDGNGYGYG
jgi:hypothetical protein